MQLSSLLRRVGSGALRNSLIVMGGFVLSRASGLLRDVIVTARFGTTAEYGAYVAAFRITDLLYMVIIGGALGSSFIPVFIQLWERDGAERAWRLASAVLTWTLALLTAASALLWLLARPLTGWLYAGPSIDAASLDLISDLTRLFLLSPLLLGLGGLAMAALNARDRFTLPALAPSLYNLGIIGGALALAPTMGVWGLAWGVVLGALLYLLVQIPGLFALGMRLRPEWGRDLPELSQVARQLGPRVLGQAAAHISVMVTAALTARLALGAEKLAALNLAYQLMLLPYGVFSLSLSTVAFPRLARLVAEGRLADLAADVRRTLGTILFLTLPAMAALLTLGLPLTRALFQRGAFDDVSLQLTAAALAGYALALPAFAASEILIRAFYAMQRTWTPVLVGLSQVLLNLALGTLLLLGGADSGALALAFGVANTAEALILIALLGRALPGIWRDADLRRTLLIGALGSLLLGGLLFGARALSLPLVPALGLGGAYLWQRDLPGLLAWLAGAGALGAALYLGLGLALGAAPARDLLRRLRPSD